MNYHTLHSDKEKHYLQHEFDSEALLVEEPIGWKNSSKKISRSKTTGEFVEKNTKEVKFIGKGRKYILNADAVHGVNCKLRYIVIKENPKDATDFFKEVYFVSLETLNDNKGKLSCKVDEGGLSKLIKSKQNEKLEIDREKTLNGKQLSTLQTQELHLSGRQIFLKSILNADSQVKVLTQIVTEGNNEKGEACFPLEVMSNSDKEHVFSQKGIIVDTQNASKSISQQHMFYYNADKDKKIKVTFEGVSFLLSLYRHEYIHEYGNYAGIKFSLRKYKDGASLNYAETLEDFYVAPDPKNPRQRLISIEDKVLPIELKKGESLGLHFITSGRFGRKWYHAFREVEGRFEVMFKECKGTVYIEEDSIHPPSNTDCVYIKDALNRYLEVLTGEQNLINSDFLDNKEGKDTVIFPLLWARKFRYENKKRKPSISYKQLLDSTCAVWGLSSMIEKVGFKEKVRIEPLNFFYHPNVTIELPYVVEDYKREYATDFLYTSFEFGSQKGGDNYEEATGVGEYNGSVIFTSKLETKENKYIKTSIVRLDSSSNEFSRRKPIQTHSQTDTRYDADFAFADTKKGHSDVLELRKSSDDFDELPKGVYSPETAYNLRFSPKHIALRHSHFITGSMAQYKSDYLRFTSSKGNSELITKPKGKKHLKEGEDILVGDLGISRFKPYWIKFKHTVDFDIQKKLRGKTIINGKELYNFYGLVGFRVADNQYQKGYIFEVDENKGEWKVLMFS